MAIVIAPLSVVLGLAPEPRYETVMPRHAEPVSTLAVHCSQSDLQRPVDAFMQFGLNIESFDRIVIPGGPKVYRASPNSPSQGFHAGGRWTSFLVENHALNRVILIGHENCGWYFELQDVWDNAAAVEEQQIHDLRESLGLAALLGLQGVTIEAYFSRIVEPGTCSFFPVLP